MATRLNAEGIEERDYKIFVMSSEGHRVKDIAERLGVSMKTVERARSRRGLAQPKRANLTPEEVERAKYLIEDEGWPPTEVMKELSCGRYTLYQHVGPTTTGYAWSSVVRWAHKNCPELFEEIQAMEVS